MSKFSGGKGGEGWLYPDDVDHEGLRLVLDSLDKVEPVKTPSQIFRAKWSALCPAHDDHNPSLAITWSESGRIGIKCWAGCSRAQILRSLEIDPAVVAPPRSSDPDKGIEAKYDYRNGGGELVYQVCRFPGKRIRYRRPNGDGGWIWNAGTDRFLYRLPELIASAGTGAPVFVCEGEKDADRVASLGLCATCNPGGAGKWRPDYSDYLADRDVVLLQDNDAAGLNHVTTIAMALAARAKTLRVVLLPGLPPKGDVSDWFEGGHTLEELLAVVDGTEPWGQQPTDPNEDEDLHLYAENKNGLYRVLGPDKPPQRLSNFTARIARQVVEDDGVEQRVTVEVVATRAGKVRSFRLSAAAFEEMKWPSAQLDARAGITPKANIRDVCYAIKLFSRDLEETTMYTHSGWRRLEDGAWAYLHGGGAIGANGLRTQVSVGLDGNLTAAVLPSPPCKIELRGLILRVLELLKVAPARIMIPLLAAVFRAPFGPAGFSIHLFGQTGVGKTCLAVLIQQFFGASFRWDCLPSNWISTGNSIELVLFQAKDMLVVVDDFNPRGASADVQRLHQTADRVFRGAANVAGRGRSTRDSRQRPTKVPRGFLLSTGEEAPSGHSLAARILLIEVGPRDVDFAALSTAQARGLSGEFASVMSAFLQFNAPDLDSTMASQPSEIALLRDQASRDGNHRRTPDAAANEMWGWKRFLAFAEASGAIERSRREELEAEGWTALQELAHSQSFYQARESQAHLFMALIDAAVQSQLAHITTFAGGKPDGGAFGWRRQTNRDGVDEFYQGGLRVGYVDENFVYLEPTIAYKIAQDTSRGGTHSLSVASTTLAGRLVTEGFLLPGDARGGKKVRKRRKKTAEGRMEFWVFKRSAFAFASSAEPDAEQGPPYEM